MTSSSTDKARAKAPGARAKATKTAKGSKSAAVTPAERSAPQRPAPAPDTAAAATAATPAAKRPAGAGQRAQPKAPKAGADGKPKGRKVKVLTEAEFNAEIGRLAGLRLPEFEACRKDAAEALGITIAKLRTLVKQWKKDQEQSRAEAAMALSQLTSAIQREGDLATMRFGNGQFSVSDKDGISYKSRDPETGSTRRTWICSALHVVARTRDEASEAWGVLLRWRDSAGVQHEMTMPADALQTDGADMRRALASGGVVIAPGAQARTLLLSYLLVWNPHRYARCVSKMGWHQGVFVMPGMEAPEVNGELTVFQNVHAVQHAFVAAGTVDEWRAGVARLCAGNSRLVVAVSVAMAGSLLEFAGSEAGGFHFKGASSTGKSTAQVVAASVWGHPAKFKRSWRFTANGLEGVAAMHNDGCLILDELSECPAKDAGEAVYMLANGQGKGRATRTGAAREAQTWRLVFLSSGEESLATLMGQVGKQAKAGQEIRLVEIEADAGAGMGMFEALNGVASPAQLSQELRTAATAKHGAVGHAWIQHLMAHRDELGLKVKSQIDAFAAAHAPAGCSGQVVRVARRFGLVAAAGELATEAGLTGWPAGHATESAAKCMKGWLITFGGPGNREDRALLSQVRSFFEQHGASRFEQIGTRHGEPVSFDVKVSNRVGFVRRMADGNQYLVLPESFGREVCAGFDPKHAAKVLIEAGWLRPGSNGKTSRTERIPGMGEKTRCYVFLPTIWSDPGEGV